MSGVLRAAILGAAALLAACASAGRDALVVHSPYGAYLAGQFAAQQRDYDAAASLFAAARGANEADGVLTERALIQALIAGRVEPAAQFAADLAADGAPHRMAQITLAAKALRHGHGARARDHLSQVDFGAINGPLAAIISAWTWAEAGDLDAALETLAPAKESLFGGYAQIHEALILERAERMDAARDAYESALQGEAAGLAHELYGRFLERAGAPDAARAFYRRILDAAPGNLHAKAGLRRLEDGRAPPLYATTARQGAGVAFVNIASALSHDAALEAPLIYVNFALYLYPDFDRAHALSGELLEQAQQWPKAAAAYGRVAEGSVFYELASVGRARALDRLGHTDAAIRLLRKVQQERASYRAAMALGDLYRAQERYAEAARAYDAAAGLLGDAPPDQAWRVYFARGVAYERTDRWPQAEADFFHALELAPDQPFVLNYLGYSWADRGERLEEAFGMIRRAVALAPREGSIVDSLGWAYYRLGRYEEAVEHLERATVLTPLDPTINDHLGDAYWRVGRKIEARFQWRKALGLDPDPQQAAAIEEKLRDGLADDQ